jgi:hypothetical protein
MQAFLPSNSSIRFLAGNVVSPSSAIRLPAAIQSPHAVRFPAAITFSRYNHVFLEKSAIRFSGANGIP